MEGMLADRFQLTSFKDWQQRAIEAAISGKDALIIQPTGSGKSLCFQFPAVWSKKTTVVITPTVSLMSDQTRMRMVLQSSCFGNYNGSSR